MEIRKSGKKSRESAAAVAVKCEEVMRRAPAG